MHLPHVRQAKFKSYLFEGQAPIQFFLALHNEYSVPWHLNATCSSSLFLQTQQNLLLKNEGPLQLWATGSYVVKTEARHIFFYQKNEVPQSGLKPCS